MTTMNRATPRVLVVDDDVDCADSLALLLQDLGCTATARHDARSAIEAAVSVLPELVIVDLALGTEDGCAVMNGIRDVLALRHRPVMVCLTGRADGRTEGQCLQRGFDLFLTKPACPDALQEVLQVVHSRRPRRPAPGSHPA